MKQYADFAVEKLVPAAEDVLLRRYEEHKKGANIGVESKGDGSPASHADREAEQAMRALIEKTFPAHGIIGEEFGLKNPDAEYVWVLDPLDGTREFLDKRDGWGTLIALMHNGKPVVGIIHDAQKKVTWRGGGGKAKKAKASVKKLAQASIACTNLTQFDHTPWKAGAKKMFESCGQPRHRLNCLGFAYVADGAIDLGAEGGLKLHDIAALLPVLWDAGAQCVMPDDGSYADYTFNLANAEKENYTLVAGRDESLVRQALAVLEGE